VCWKIEYFRKLVLYEAAWPRVVEKEALARLEELAQSGDWEGFAVTFFHHRLSVPLDELNELRATEPWPPIIADAEASLRDLRALSGYDFDVQRFRDLRVPVMLQIGTESPRELYVTDALAAVLPDVCIQDRLGLLSDCHRRIERFFNVLLTIARQANGKVLESQRWR
jgi:hypothetical protein